MRPGSDETAVTLWGDGFADDGWTDIVGVRDWENCSTDEYVRVFPGLLPRDAKVPPVLRRHLEMCVAVRARRIGEAMGHGGVGALRSLRIEPDGSADRRGSRSLWFADARRRPDEGMPVRARATADCEEELADLHFLDGILEAIQRDRMPAFDTSLAVRFAFLTGIHPAYLWPEALPSHELFTAAGWLGHLDRGRPALMPSDLAAYFLEIIDISTGVPVVRDACLAGLLGARSAVAKIRRAAAQRLRGRSRVVKGRAVRCREHPDEVVSSRRGPNA